MPHRMTQAFVSLLMGCAAVAGASGTEYFVGLEGDDTNDGRSAAQAFRTVQHGVDALAEGDTLTILPGEYFETVFRKDLGGPERETVIRAALPGTVLLRGDVPAPPFQPVAGYRFVHQAEFDRPVQAVNERDTLRILEGAAGIAELEFVPGAFYHDAERGRLYISSSDLAPPQTHTYTVSVLGSHGLCLDQPRAVRVTRCFKDGRGAGYSPNFVAAWKSPDLLIRNCVMAVGFTGFSAANCPGLRLEHNVFLRNMIQAAIVVNAPDQPFTLTNNIITDSGANKSRTTLLEIGRVESMIERDNQYVLRLPDEEKRLFMFYGGAAYARTIPAYDLPPHDAPPVFTELNRSSLAAYHAQFGDTGSAVGDAAFRIAREMPRENAEGQPIFIPDRVIGIPDLDFPDLFTMDPDLVRREIGLRPADFEDFHFVHDR